MPKQRGVFVVQTQATPGREAEYAEWYDSQHLPEVIESLRAAGFVSARRFMKVPEAGTPTDEWSSCLVVYEVEADDLAQSYAMLAAQRERGDIGPNELVKLPVRFHFYEEVARSPAVET
jgi:hypothetical protein